MNGPKAKDVINKTVAACLGLSFIFHNPAVGCLLLSTQSTSDSSR